MIIINNSPWYLRFVPPNHPILINDDGRFTLGVTVLNHHTIYIANNIRGARLHHVLAHELFHAEMMSRGVNVPTYIEEALADLIADYSLETLNIADYVHQNLCRIYHIC